MPHHALSQINQAYSSVKDVTSLNKTGVDGGGAAFVSPHSDDLSIWNWLWHKLNPSQNEILNRVTTHPILLGNDNSPVKKKMKLAENKVREVYTAHLLQLGLSIDPRNIVFVKQELRPGNMVVFVFLISYDVFHHIFAKTFVLFSLQLNFFLFVFDAPKVRDFSFYIAESL